MTNLLRPNEDLRRESLMRLIQHKKKLLVFAFVSSQVQLHQPVFLERANAAWPN